MFPPTLAAVWAITDPDTWTRAADAEEAAPANRASPATVAPAMASGAASSEALDGVNCVRERSPRESGERDISKVEAAAYKTWPALDAPAFVKFETTAPALCPTRSPIKATRPPWPVIWAPESMETAPVAAPKAMVRFEGLLRKVASGVASAEVVARRPPTSTTACEPKITPPGATNQTLPL